MSTSMPELGSKISLISKADIRYEGRLFTVDPQECTIALASVRSFGTEDRETQFPVAPQTQVYDYILFRGSDIKDIRVVNNVPSIANDPAIVQMSVPTNHASGTNQGQYSGQYGNSVLGQATQQYGQYHPMSGFPASVHAQLSKPSELSPQTSMDLAPQPLPTAAPIGSGVIHHGNQVKDQGSVLDFIGGGSQQTSSRSGTPAGHRKSPTADQGTQVGSIAGSSGQRDSRRGGVQKAGQQRARPNSRTRQRLPSGGSSAANAPPSQTFAAQPQQQQQQQQQQQSQQPQHLQQQHHHRQPAQGFGRGGWRGRPRGRGRGFVSHNKNTLKFDNDYDFEQANTEFEELRSQLAKTKISEAETPKVEVEVTGEVDKKDDSGNETGAGEPEVDEDPSAYSGYDKNKSFFDNISCEAVERSKGRSQRTDWRTERKLNSETFGVASARRGSWRGRANWRHNQHNMHNMHNQHHQPWRAMRGARGRGNNNLRQPRPTGVPASTTTHNAQPATAAAK